MIHQAYFLHAQRNFITNKAKGKVAGLKDYDVEFAINPIDLHNSYSYDLKKNGEP
jgi:hypothetical protein